MSHNLPHRANVGEIIRVRGYEGYLFLVMELLEEVSHDAFGTEKQVVYTCRNVDNYKDIRAIFDEDVISIVVTAGKADEYIARRQEKNGNLPAIRSEDKSNNGVGGFAVDIAALMKQYEEAKKSKEQKKASANNAPRSPWAKEREAKRVAYEYIDFLLERYGDLISMQQVMPHDDELQVEIDLVRAEFMTKSGEKVIQDGKFS